MTDEIRAAAERLLQGVVVEQGDGYEITQGPSPDVRLVAEAVLAEHPADGDEPVDEAWLRSIGFEPCGPFNDLQIKLPKNVEGFTDYLRVSDNVGEGPVQFHDAHWTVWNYENSSNKPEGAGVHRGLTTRRAVRDLCRGLGIQLNEGGAT